MVPSIRFGAYIVNQLSPKDAAKRDEEPNDWVCKHSRRNNATAITVRYSPDEIQQLRQQDASSGQGELSKHMAPTSLRWSHSDPLLPPGYFSDELTFFVTAEGQDSQKLSILWPAGKAPWYEALCMPGPINAPDSVPVLEMLARRIQMIDDTGIRSILLGHLKDLFPVLQQKLVTIQQNLEKDTATLSNLIKSLN